MNKDKLKISIILNLIIVIMVIFASTTMFLGFKYMHFFPDYLESSKIGMFRFFTVLSNLYMGIVSLIFLIKGYSAYKENTEISLFYYILKLTSTVAVSLTFFIVFAYLGPISKYGILSMLMNSNLFFHLLVPVLSIVTFTVFEKNNKLIFKYTLYALIPTILYEIYYLTHALSHMENGMVSPIYDFYYFLQNGVWTSIIVGPMIILLTYIIAIIIWKLNKSKSMV